MNPNNINQLIQMLGAINNPEQALQGMMKNNPQMKAMMTQIQQSGMNPTAFLQNYAKQNNIDLSPIKDMLNQKGVKF